MNKRFAEEQIIGFLCEAEAGLPIRSRRLASCLISTAQGRVIKSLAVVNEPPTRLSPLFRNEPFAGLVDVHLDRLTMSLELSKAIRTDNGKEFCGRTMLTWAHQ